MYKEKYIEKYNLAGKELIHVMHRHLMKRMLLIAIQDWINGSA